MRETSIRELQHHLSAMMESVEHGEEIVIKKRNRVIARLIPDRSPKNKVNWPDFSQRANSLFSRCQGSALSESLAQDRDDRR